MPIIKDASGKLVLVRKEKLEEPPKEAVEASAGRSMRVEIPEQGQDSGEEPEAATVPANVARQQLSAFRVAKLLVSKGLTRWERKFLASIAHYPRLSPKQQQVLDKLAEKYLEAKAP